MAQANSRGEQSSARIDSSRLDATDRKQVGLSRIGAGSIRRALTLIQPALGSADGDKSVARSWGHLRGKNRTKT